MGRLMEFLARPRIWFFGYLVWFVVLFVLSEQHGDAVKVQTFPHSDKVAHACYFAIGATLLGVGALARDPQFPRRVLFVVLVVAGLAVGVFDEWHQSFTPGRDGNSPGDIAADVLGSVIGFFVSVRLFRFAHRKSLLRGSAP